MQQRPDRAAIHHITILYPFTAAAVQSGEVASGSIDLNQPISNGSSISGDSLLTLINAGLLYTNVHTAATPAGRFGDRSPSNNSLLPAGIEEGGLPEMGRNKTPCDGNVGQARKKQHCRCDW